MNLETTTNNLNKKTIDNTPLISIKIMDVNVEPYDEACNQRRRVRPHPMLRDGATAGHRACSAAASPDGPAPRSATSGRAQLTEADILHHGDARIDARQDARTEGEIEGLENLKREMHLGKIHEKYGIILIIHSY
jgi:hypothetical protein